MHWIAYNICSIGQEKSEKISFLNAQKSAKNCLTATYVAEEIAENRRSSVDVWMDQLMF